MEEPLVRVQAGVRRSAGRRPQDPRLREEPQGQVRQAAVSGHCQDRDRADPRRSESHLVFRPPRHPHRPQGGARRGAAEGTPGQDGTADQHQDRRTQPARNGRPVGGRGHCRAVDQAFRIPPHDEAVDGTDDGSRGQGDQDPAFRPAGRGGNVAPRETDRRLDPAVDAAGEDRLRLHRSQDRPRPHRHPGVDQSRHL